ncbi:MAG: DUF393 domain-containing protein [Saprospiraceae bacterium]|nr:DUF393 domain-containing protein [Saprospiraceae bacterium]
MKSSTQHIIFFDGLCVLCQGFIGFVWKHDKNNTFAFSSLQSPYATQHKEAYGISQTIDSVVYFDGKNHYYKSTAALKILNQLGGWKAWLYPFIFIPRPLRDLVYDFVALIRYRVFGKSKEVCEVMDEAMRRKVIWDVN